jgi:hypothetical protein
MLTKHHIHKSLALIGENGFDGVLITARNHIEAYTFMHRALFDSVEANKLYSEMRRQKLINVTSEDSREYRIALTPFGAQRLIKANMQNIYISPMKQWDNVWRCVAFTFPSGKDKERLQFYHKLQALGFYQLKRSFWIHPFECEAEIRAITDYLSLTKYVVSFDICRIDNVNKEKLYRHFENILSKR